MRAVLDLHRPQIEVQGPIVRSLYSNNLHAGQRSQHKRLGGVWAFDFTAMSGLGVAAIGEQHDCNTRH